MRPHDWFVEQHAGYVSGSLGGDELQEFERHLAGCEECTLEVTRLEQELGWLPMGLPPAAPRPGFQQRVVENVLRRPAVAARRPRPWVPALALAASALLVVGGWYLGGNRARQLERHLEQQRQAVAALQDTLSIMRQAGRILQANLDVGDTQGGLLIFADDVTHRWNVVIHGLPPAAAGHRYQFWFICDEGMVRGNAITVDPAKPTMFTTGMPQPKSCPAVKGAALTEELAGDAEGPPRGKSLAHLML